MFVGMASQAQHGQAWGSQVSATVPREAKHLSFLTIGLLLLTKRNTVSLINGVGFFLGLPGEYSQAKALLGLVSSGVSPF